MSTETFATLFASSADAPEKVRTLTASKRSPKFLEMSLCSDPNSPAIAPSATSTACPSPWLDGGEFEDLGPPCDSEDDSCNFELDENSPNILLTGFKTAPSTTHACNSQTPSAVDLAKWRDISQRMSQVFNESVEQEAKPDTKCRGWHGVCQRMTDALSGASTDAEEDEVDADDEKERVPLARKEAIDSFRRWGVVGGRLAHIFQDAAEEEDEVEANAEEIIPCHWRAVGASLCDVFREAVEQDEWEEDPWCQIGGRLATVFRDAVEEDDA